MSEKPASDPMDLFQISRELLSAPQKFMPSTRIYSRMGEIMRDVAQANATYMQELMRANAALLAAVMERPMPGLHDRPAQEVHKPEQRAS